MRARIVSKWKSNEPVETRRFPEDVDFIEGWGVYMKELEKLLNNEGISPQWIGVPGKSLKNVYPHMFHETF